MPSNQLVTIANPLVATKETQMTETADEPKPKTPAEISYAEWERRVDILDTWEKNEIKFCRGEINKLLIKYQSSAMLAVVAMSLRIAIQEGQ